MHTHNTQQVVIWQTEDSRGVVDGLLQPCFAQLGAVGASERRRVLTETPRHSVVYLSRRVPRVLAIWLRGACARAGCGIDEVELKQRVVVKADCWIPAPTVTIPGASCTVRC